MNALEKQTEIGSPIKHLPDGSPIFEQDSNHRLSGEMCLVHNVYRILHEAGVALPAYDEYVTDLVEDAFGEEAHRWMHRPVATFILDCYGANLLSLDVRYSSNQDMDRILRFGRVVSREGLTYLRQIESQGVPDDMLALADLFRSTGKESIISVTAGFNGYNGSIRPGDTHSLRYMGRHEDGRIIVYDNDARPHENVDGRRPEELYPLPGRPAMYLVDEAYLRKFLNTHVVAVWPGKSMPKTTTLSKEHSALVRERLLEKDVRLVECDGFGGMRLDELDGMTIAYSDGANVDDGECVYDFVESLYGAEIPVMTIDTSGLAAEIIEFHNGDELEIHEGRRALYVPGKVDGIVFRKPPELPVVIGGADCQICVGVARTTDGERVSFALHLGTRNILGGLTERFIDRMRALDVEPTTMSLHIGPSAFALEYQKSDIDSWATSDTWVSAIVATEGDSLIYSPMLDCIYRLKMNAGDLLGEIRVAGADTLRKRSLYSHRRASNGGYAYCGLNGVMLLPNIPLS